MAYTTIDDPSAYFQTTLWTGNDTARSITNTGNSDLQPDWVWINNYGSSQNNRTFDSVRGAGINLVTNSNGAEIDAGTGTDGQLRSFASDGFTIGTDGSVNKNNEGIVAWSWKAGTAFSNDASSTSVGSIDSAGSVSTAAGFSIITWTGNTSNETIAHGLGAVPKVIIFKTRAIARDWRTYTETVGNGSYLKLNANTATTSSSNTFNDTSPTSTVFSVGGSDSTNAGGNMIAYCFADVQGYSKFGSYTGNGNADGTFIYTGFKPAFIIVKNTANGHGWQLRDHKRTTFNELTNLMYANATSVEQSTDGIDFLSNGWKLRNSAGDNNASGNTYVYMAFAENPFVTSTGIPTPAR